MDKCTHHRRLVVCFDGTWNTPAKDATSTNVVKLVRAIRNRDDDGISQITFYDKGVGTNDPLDAVLGGALGWGLTENVIDGYRFLANNHEPGDEIYIFGFSRGAYTARSLAGLVGFMGLMAPIDLGGCLQSAVETRHRTDLESAQKLKMIRERQSTEARSATIKCVGVWDTVGSLGIPGDIGRNLLRGKYYQFHEVGLSPKVDVALHAIAVDEKRGPFAPTTWVSKDGAPARKDQAVEQVWFAGAHANVGGSYPDSRLSDIALKWMVQRVGKHTKLALDLPGIDKIDTSYAKGTGIDSRGDCGKAAGAATAECSPRAYGQGTSLSSLMTSPSQPTTSIFSPRLCASITAWTVTGR